MAAYPALILVWAFIEAGWSQGVPALKTNLFPPRTAEASRKKKENRRKWKRYLLIGLATVGGGTVIGKASPGWAGVGGG